MFQKAEMLESRCLFASTITVNGLDVDIIGTNGAETINVIVSGNVFPFSPLASIELNGRLTRLDPAKGQDYRFHIWGKGGDDRIDVEVHFGLIAEAIVYGGRGNDTIEFVNSGIEHGIIYGDAGDDTIRLSTNSGGKATTVFAGSGRDILIGGDSDAFIDCGPGNDRVWGGAGNETIYGQDGNDVILGQDGNDCLYGGPGNDLIAGSNGDDRLFGNEGSDTLIGESGNNALFPGPDRGLLYPAFAPRKLRLLIESLLAARP